MQPGQFPYLGRAVEDIMKMVSWVHLLHVGHARRWGVLTGSSVLDFILKLCRGERFEYKRKLGGVH